MEIRFLSIIFLIAGSSNLKDISLNFTVDTYFIIKNNPAATAIANIAIAKLSKTAGVVSSIITSLDFDNPANICTKKYYTTYAEQIANYGNKAIRCAGVGSGSYYIYEKNDYLRVSTKVNTPAGSTSWTRSYSYTVYN